MIGGLNGRNNQKKHEKELSVIEIHFCEVCPKKLKYE